MHLRLLLLLNILILAQAGAADTSSWRHLDIQGMGFVTGVLVHPTAPGHTWLKTDVGGVFRWLPDQGRWINVTDHLAYVIESLALDAQAPASVLMAAEGQIWRSDDLGSTWTSTGLVDVFMNGNGDRRRAGERLVVDSAGSSSVLWFGSRRQGLWRRVDDGAWTQIPTAAVPAGTHDLGITSVAVDHASAVGQSSARIIYAGVTGDGIYRSTDGGASWARMTGGPGTGQNPVRLQVAADGTLYVTCMSGSNDYNVGTDGAVWRWRNASWTSIAPVASQSWGPLAVHPTLSDRLVVATYNSRATDWIWRSDDAGASWTAVPLGNPTVPPSWPTWHLWGWSGGLAIASQEPDRLWVTTGFGVLTTANHRIATPSWTAPMQGVEELVVNHARITPAAAGGHLVLGVADMFAYRLADAQATVSPVIPDGFGIATGIDWAQSDPQTLIVVGSDQNHSNPLARISRDGGSSWSGLANPDPTANYSGVFGGNIAIAADDADSFVWAPQTASWADNGKDPPGVWYTRNGGSTWSRVSGLPTRINQLDQHWFPSTVLVADRVAAGTFYLLTGNGHLLGICWRSTDYGATWQQRSSAPEDWDYKTKVVAHPTASGELWVAYGTYSTSSLHRGTDGGATWTWIAGIERATDVALGAPAPGHDTPTVFLNGRIAGVDGIYRSDDASSLPGNAEGATWTLISSPDMPLAKVINLAADPSVHGRLIVCTSGRGAFLIECDQPPPAADHRDRAGRGPGQPRLR